MARDKLSDNATIAEIVNLLDNRIEYVRGAFANMNDYKKVHGSALIRIGTTGVGIVPHYRIEPFLEDKYDILDDMEDGGEALARHFVAFHGRNHKRLEWGMAELRGNNWSKSKTDIEAVRALLGDLRGFKSKSST